MGYPYQFYLSKGHVIISRAKKLINQTINEIKLRMGSSPKGTDIYTVHHYITSYLSNNNTPFISFTLIP